MTATITFSVLTVSDRCSRGTTEDTTGPALRRLLEDRCDAVCLNQECVPDAVDEIGQTLRHWTDGDRPPDFVMTTGGTGLASRDVTPEAMQQILDRQHAGLMELIRLRCYESTPRAFLSRGIAGTRKRTLIVNLPGSIRGAMESLEALLDILPHAIETLRDEIQDDGRPSADPGIGKVIHHRD